MYLFYGTVLFAAAYLLNYHVLATGKLQTEEYTIQMNQAKAEKLERDKKAGEGIDENTVKQLTDAGGIAFGKAAYTKFCVLAYGSNGEGKGRT